MSGEHTAFFYGTLVIAGHHDLVVMASLTSQQMVPEIFFTVCYGSSCPSKIIRSFHTFTPAILNGYCRRRIRLVDYPGVVPDPNHNVRGVYATGLTDANIQKLDEFEGTEYDRIPVRIRLLDSSGDEGAGEEKGTFLYVFLYPEEMEKHEWDFENFFQEKMMKWAR